MGHLIHQVQHLFPPAGCTQGFYQTSQEHADYLLLVVDRDETVFPVLFQEENGLQWGGVCRNIRNITVAPGPVDLEALWPSSYNYPVVAQDLDCILQHHHHGGLARV